ncbi:phage terminase small subunit P27 family [Radiobacillus deserti]|uniref:Phage terminase small subunit P27 family n=1 Tax=Radiobacillus deserti TaxID=2594883 RepID=A0A516KDF6_9BACI|nr:phage terminase small subunit P27 family [Radiobacillus deserti]QDP39442.1 phage terminase small subunit P27 family [Radiobacillus deserti]
MKAPEYFNETATKYFDFVVEELIKIDRLNTTDKPIIEGLAFNLSTMEECQKILLKEGFVLEGLHGKKEHPAVAISMKAQSKVLESFKILGLDASMRLKIDKNEDQQSDFIAALIG